MHVHTHNTILCRHTSAAQTQCVNVALVTFEISEKIIAPCKGIRIPESEKHLLDEDCGIRDIIFLRNPEYWALDSGIQLKDPGFQLWLESGIQVPPTKNPDSSTCNPESTVWNPESKIVLDSLLWDENYHALHAKTRSKQLGRPPNDSEMTFRDSIF